MMADLYSKPVNAITYDDLKAFFTTGEPPIEGDRLDGKVELIDRVVETIVGMANTDGGLILIGFSEIESAGQSTKRLKWPPVAIDSPSIQDALASKCHTKIRPNYVPGAKLIDVPGQSGRYVLVIRVDLRRAPRPLWHEDKGVLVRVGDQNRPADLETLRHLLLEPASLAESSALFTEWGQHLRTPGGSVPLLSIIAQYPRAATEFASRDKLALANAVARYFDFDLTGARLSSSHRGVEIVAMRPEKQRQVIARFAAAGVGSIQTMPLVEVPEIPWDWVLGESYLALRCFQTGESAQVYGQVQDVNVVLCLSNWPTGGVSVQGLFDGRPSVGGRSLQGTSVLHEDELSAENDPWKIAKSFMGIVLGDAGYLQYELRLARLERDQFLSLYFVPGGVFQRGTFTSGGQ
jgi:hypothetical protein